MGMHVPMRALVNSVSVHVLMCNWMSLVHMSILMFTVLDLVHVCIVTSAMVTRMRWFDHGGHLH
jgi:hypothetical protein